MGHLRNQIRIGVVQMSDDAPAFSSFSSAFSIVLSLARKRIVDLGCAPVGKDPKAFVDSGGLSRLESEAASAAIRSVREAAYPLILNLFGSKMPRGKERRLVLTKMGQDLARIEEALGYSLHPTSDDIAKQTGERADGIANARAAQQSNPSIGPARRQTGVRGSRHI
jgi:hypothetical protein